MSVASLDQKRAEKTRAPYITGRAKCLSCDHTWSAVAPTGTHPTSMECPQCKLMRGAWFAAIEPCDGHFVMACSVCGSQHFCSMMTPDKSMIYLHCIGCGNYINDFTIPVRTDSNESQ